ncbi:MAG: hypothetical protein J0M04_01465 [Verrucomicrobia bacterium]|nr:hypothetical protein [Verrucomicrobiota bacterium]
MRATIFAVRSIVVIVVGLCFLVGGYILGVHGRKDNIGRPLINNAEAIYRKGEHLEESEERLARNSGFWATNDGVCGVDLDYRIISFSKSGYKGGWEELNGNKYLIGQGMDFMTNTGFYYIDCLDESEMILRKETFSSPEITWVDTVTFRKIDKSKNEQ